MVDDTANSGIDPIPSEYRAIIVKHTKAGYVGESSVLLSMRWIIIKLF